jgi:hypothetical protein
MKKYMFRLTGTLFLLSVIASSDQEAIQQLPLVHAWCVDSTDQVTLERVLPLI